MTSLIIQRGHFFKIILYYSFVKLIKRKPQKISEESKEIKSICSCEYLGRFGNNLFQIATTLSLAKNNNCTAVFKPWSYKDAFEKQIICRTHNKDLTIYNEQGFNYSPIPFKDNMIINGYFQSEKYFDKYLVKSYFEPKKAVKQKLISKYSEYLDKSVSIHVRRGDYLYAQDYHPVQTKEYYMKAMSEFSSDSIFFVFSDDINWCKDNLSEMNCRFIEDQKDYEDMFLMSMCRHNIIANSSFSWWGAWLNNNPSKKVIAPEKWFGPNCPHDTKDLIPEYWVRK
jgi:hypothetical protein